MYIHIYNIYVYVYIYLLCQGCSKNNFLSGEKSEVERRSSKQNVDLSSSNAVQTSRKRRVGIVENQYVAESDAGSSVCDLVQSLERVLGEKNKGVTMKSKKQQNALEGIVDPIEENETYDEFDTVRMPVVRSLSKSPQSDEGIETDTDRRRGSMARCWSLDSAAASDEDTSLTTHQQKRHKLRVTRCCSSDSAVLSDEDQIKGEGDGIMPPVALSRRQWRGENQLKTRSWPRVLCQWHHRSFPSFFSHRLTCYSFCSVDPLCFSPNGGIVNIFWKFCLLKIGDKWCYDWLLC